MMKKFEEFEMPDDSVIQCYARKYKSYHKDNIPFFEYIPSEEELLINSRICEQKKREKEAAQAAAKRRRDEKRKENASRRKRANDENLDRAVPEVPEEVPEEVAQDYIDDLIEDLAGHDPELDALIGRFVEQNHDEDEIVLEEVQERPKRRQRKRRPAPKLRDQFEF